MRLRTPTLKRPRTTVAVVVALILAGGGGAWAATRSSSSDNAAPTLVSATSSTIRQTVSASGTVQPAHRADLSFAVSGTVTSMRVAVGDRVAVGTTLATVGSTSLQSALSTAQANVTSTQAQLSSEVAAGSSAVQIASTKAQLADLTGRLADAHTALTAATMASPLAGTVAQVSIAKGDVVAGSASPGTSASSSNAGSSSSAGSSSNAGSAASSSSSATAQIVVISTTSWVVQANVGSADLASLKKGLQAEITPGGSPSKVFGTVSSVGIIASSSSGSATFPVTIAVTGNPKGLYVGGAADVSIIVRQIENVLTVPTGSLHTESGKIVVHQMKDGTQVSTPVTIGATYGQASQVLSGLRVGDKVVGTAFRSGGSNPAGGARSRQGGGTGSGAGGFGGGGIGGGGFGGPPAGAAGVNG